MLGATALAATGASASASSGAGWRAKVDPAVLAAAAQGSTQFIVYLARQADLSGARSLVTKEEKGRYVYRTLTALARETQPPVVAELERLGLKQRPFWITNTIWSAGGLEAVETMATRRDVAHVYAVGAGRIPRPIEEKLDAEVPDVAEWGVSKIRAPEVWAHGYTGQGAVVAGADTGIRWTHNALKSKYRGWNGASGDHSYNWHDAIHSGGGSCGPNSLAPCDDNGHGSHTIGTIVGDDGAGNQVGVAPGARWIGCRNMNQGVGSVATYQECMEWFIAPTDVNGQNPDSTKAPDVVNNSWACDASEGCAPVLLKQQLLNSVAAGIVYVSSAGNSGPQCSTVTDPLGVYRAALTVGATDTSDAVASFSSRGPAVWDTEDNPHREPDVSAPGVSVRSSTRTSDTSYGALSGTSMSAPHVAGLVALIISANPGLAGNVARIREIIEETAVPRNTVGPVGECGGESETQVPNNVYGWGRVDAVAAVAEALTPTAVTFASFAAGGTRAGVSLRWRAATQIGQLGFNVWRSTEPARRYQRLNRSLIVAKPLGAAGASYRYVDRAAARGRTYVYKVEAVGLTRRSSWAGPVRAQRR